MEESAHGNLGSLNFELFSPFSILKAHIDLHVGSVVTQSRLQILALPRVSCVTLEKSFIFPVQQYPY